MRRRLRGVRQRTRSSAPCRTGSTRTGSRTPTSTRSRRCSAAACSRPTAAGAIRCPTHRGYEDWDLWMDLAQDGAPDRARRRRRIYRRRLHAPGLDVKPRARHAEIYRGAARRRTRGCSPSCAAHRRAHRPLDAAQAALSRPLRRAAADQPRAVRQAATRPGRRLDAGATAAVARAGTCARRRGAGRTRPRPAPPRRRSAPRIAPGSVGSRRATATSARAGQQRPAERAGPARTRACAGCRTRSSAWPSARTELSATPAAPSAPHSGIATRLHAMFWITTAPAMRTRMPGESRPISSVARERLQAVQRDRAAQQRERQRRAGVLVAVQQVARSGPRSTRGSRRPG